MSSTLVNTEIVIVVPRFVPEIIWHSSVEGHQRGLRVHPIRLLRPYKEARNSYSRIGALATTRALVHLKIQSKFLTGADIPRGRATRSRTEPQTRLTGGHYPSQRGGDLGSTLRILGYIERGPIPFVNIVIRRLDVDPVNQTSASGLRRYLGVGGRPHCHPYHRVLTSLDPKLFDGRSIHFLNATPPETRIVQRLDPFSLDDPSAIPADSLPCEHKPIGQMPRHDTIPSLFHGKRYLIRTTKYGGYVATCPKMEGWGVLPGPIGVLRVACPWVRSRALPGPNKRDGRFAGNKYLYDGM